MLLLKPSLVLKTVIGTERLAHKMELLIQQYKARSDCEQQSSQCNWFAVFEISCCRQRLSTHFGNHKYRLYLKSTGVRDSHHGVNPRLFTQGYLRTLPSQPIKTTKSGAWMTTLMILSSLELSNPCWLSCLR